MLIRSQNKKELVQMNKILIQVSGTEVICYDISCIADEGYVCLGKYESEAKSMKVLDMIQEAYTDAELIPMTVPNIGKMFAEAPATKENELLAEAIGKALMNKMVFQMPADSEVEV